MSKYVRKFWFEGQLALALGATMLMAAVALAAPVAWPIDADGEVLNNKICEPASTACTYPLNVCYNTAITDAALVQFRPYFKTTAMRQHGTCSTGANHAGDTCTKYPKFTCAIISFYQNVACQNFLRKRYVYIESDICDAS